MAAAAAAADDGCTFYRCFCSWQRGCASRIPRVYPGRDYVHMPASAYDDDRPMWSLLVGLTSVSQYKISDAVLGLHRFRVARSGRILGSINDALDVMYSIHRKGGFISVTKAALMPPDGHGSLCLFSEHVDPGNVRATPRAQQLRLTSEATAVPSPLPGLPLEPYMRCHPVLAAGRVWAPYVFLDRRCRDKCWLGMLRLSEDAHCWEQVGDDLFPFDYKAEIGVFPDLFFFAGYSVLQEDTILVSLRSAKGLFLTFDCSSGTWSVVTAQKRGHEMFVPISGRGVYVKKRKGSGDDKDDGTVYFVRQNVIYAYRLYYYYEGYEDDQGQPKQRKLLKLEPPTIIDVLCPFGGGDGFGYLTHLHGELMCSAWIATKLRCSCDHLHVLLTTFRVRSRSDEEKGIEIIHSTCRRLNTLPTATGQPIHGFCFLQECEDKSAIISPSVLLPVMLDGQTTSSHVMESSKMLHCCRSFVSESVPRKFGKPAVEINKDLYIVCEARSQSIVYIANIEDGILKCHDEFLKQKYTLVVPDDGAGYHVLGRSPQWHLVFSNCGSKFYLISNTKDIIYVCSLMVEAPKLVECAKPTSDPFSMVFRVGDRIIGLSDTLHVCYYREQNSWVYSTRYSRGHGPLILKGRKAILSGYAVIDDHSFVVTDDITRSFLFFDLSSRKWSFLRGTLPGTPLLKGRSVYLDGFIYTCSSGGLLAYELVQHEQGDCLKALRDPIFLPFSWKLSRARAWVPERMCLDYCAGKDNISDVIIFFVVQGEFRSSHPGSRRSHDVHVTTLEVKTEWTVRHTRKPKKIDHVDIGTCFIEHDEQLVRTKRCYAVGS